MSAGTENTCQKGRTARAVRASVRVAPIVAVMSLMVIAVLMPSAVAAPAPDLVIYEDEVQVTPATLIEGVEANVDFTVWNLGEQNAFAFIVSLFDQGTEVAKHNVEGINIGYSYSGSVAWTPSRPGTYPITVRAWYGEGSSKVDQDWADNEVNVTVTVLSRPDVRVTNADMSFTAPDVNYVVDGEEVTITAVLHNDGSAPVQSCNVSWYEGRVGGPLIGFQTGLTIPGSGSAPARLTWNTSDFSGKRTVYVLVSGVVPTETNLANNRASMPIKIHTKEDKIFSLLQEKTITSDYKIQFFIIVKDQAKLTITETGLATMYQSFDDQFEIEVMGNGQLIIDGGSIVSERNFTVRLYDYAQLTMMNGASAQFRIIAAGDCTVSILGSDLAAPSISMAGGQLTVQDAEVTADNIDLAGTDVAVDGSQLNLERTLYLSGPSIRFVDSSVTVMRSYETMVGAIDAYPSIEEADADTNEIDGLPPAMVATSGSVVDLVNVSVESQVYVEEDDKYFWTRDRIGASGRNSVINVHRYIDVEVVDWGDQVVANAEVKVLDYFDDEVLVNGTTDDEGHITLTIMTDYVTEARSPYVGNMRLRASAHGKTSEDVRFSHAKYPIMDFANNTKSVTVVMPPNPHPPIGKTYVRYTSDHLIEGHESGLDENIIVSDAVLTLRNTTFTLIQEHPFEWFILVEGQNGVLELDNATLRSDHLFYIYLQNGGSLKTVRNSRLPNVRIVAEDTANIDMRDTSMGGGIYANCGTITTVRSNLDVYDTHLEADTISLSGGYIHVTGHLLITGHQVSLQNIEITAAYAINKDYGIKTMKDLVTRAFSWAIVNDWEKLTNISHGFFTYYAEESNVTIMATNTLSTSDAFVFATETNIIVTRRPIFPQMELKNTWIGGLSLHIEGDDIEATGCSFNRVLDDFKGTDKATFTNVEVPSIVCKEGAIVERSWWLTVHARDAAGSIQSGALLEVFSTETGEKLYPRPGTELLPSSRTDANGMIRVSILANYTDDTGDYFVGSIRYRLVYDYAPFNVNPISTAWHQNNMLSNLEVTLTLPEVIVPPVKEIMYVIFEMDPKGDGTYDVKLYNHTFDNNDDLRAFLNRSTGIDSDLFNLRPWRAVEGAVMNMSFEVQALINDVWIPHTEGEVRITILQAPYDINDPVISDNKTLQWSVDPDKAGCGYVNITMPVEQGQYQLYVDIQGGMYDQQYYPVPERFWTFNVSQPLIIEIVEARVTPSRINVGTKMFVQGQVRYVFTNKPVPNAEITVSGIHIPQKNQLTNEDGRFYIELQAPMQITDNASVRIHAVDISTDEESDAIVYFSVSVQEEEEVEPETPWKLIIGVIIIIIVALAVALFIVSAYHRQYGELVECGECGAFIPKNSTRCPKCNIEFETDLARCSECEAWIPANSPSCPVCGTAFTIESLEEQVAAEEAKEEIEPIDEVTTTTARITPLTLEASTQATKWGEKEEKRRRRIKKRVKKRLTVTDAEGAAAEEPEEASDLFVGEGEEPTRLPGLGVDESMLSDDELNRLLPTEEMLKDLMLTTEAVSPAGEFEGEEADTEITIEEHMLEGEPGEEAPEPEELEEIPPIPEEGEELPEEPYVPPAEEEPMPEELEGEDEMPESRELLTELGLVAGVPPEELEAVEEEEAPEEEEPTLSGILAEEETKEAPKLCPNCGGNWILYKDGEYTCRICGEKW